MKKLIVINFFEKKLALRSTARKLFNLVVCEDFNTLDFINIEFMSRSFANELLRLEKEHNLEIRKINMNSEVSFMVKNALENNFINSKETFKIGNLDDLMIA